MAEIGYDGPGQSVFGMWDDEGGDKVQLTVQVKGCKGNRPLVVNGMLWWFLCEIEVEVCASLG